MSETAAIIAGLVSLIVSTVVTIFTGDRWVERAQRKNFHSQQFIEVINQFFTSFDGVFPTDSVYDYENKCYKEAIVSGFEGVSQGRYLEEHIRTGYPEIASKVDEYIENHNKLMNLSKKNKNEIAEIIIQTASDVKIPVYVSVYRKQDEYINIDHYIIVFVKELDAIIRGNGDLGLTTFKSKIFDNMDKSINVSWGSYQILAVKNEDQANAVKTRTLFLLNSESIQSQYMEYQAEKRSLLKIRIELTLMLTEVRNQIDLGNIIKGKCSACPYKGSF